MKCLVLICFIALAGCNLFDSVDDSEVVAPADMHGDDVGDAGDFVGDGGLDFDFADMIEPDLGPDLDEQDAGDDAGATTKLPPAVVAYDFDTSGPNVPDRTGGTPYDLRGIGAVEFREDRTVALSTGGFLRSASAPAELVQAVHASKNFALAIWLKTDAVDQGGSRQDPATNVRIVTMSVDSGTRNFMFAQWFESGNLRLRTSDSTANGIPETIVPEVFADTSVHFYLYQVRNGVLELYRDGILLQSEPASGEIAGWDDTYPLLIGDEETGGRDWAGVIHSLALYDQGFDSRQISDAFRLGPDGLVPASLP